MTRLFNLSTMQATATTTGIIAAVLLALNIDMFLTAYILFFISASLWALYAYIVANRQLLVMNIVFVCINAMGVYNFS